MGVLRSAARSAARSTARSAAHSAAFSSDAERIDAENTLGPLWGSTEVPDIVRQNHDTFLDALAQDPDWQFWRRWYLEMWNGTFQDWSLANEIAVIEDELWEGDDALSKVAARIREIEARYSGAQPRPDSVPELESSKLTEHVKRLLAAPEMTAIAAEGAADLLSKAITQYLVEADANCLPDPLAHLENMPRLFQHIARTVRSSDVLETKEIRLAAQIEELNGRVADLEAQLKAALENTMHGVFKKNAIAAMGKAFGAGLVGSLGLTLVHFFGQWPDDLTLENFRGFLEEVPDTQPKDSEGDALPIVTDA